MSYRVILTGLTAGVHKLVFSYQTIHSSKHAIDYLGSYDTTETTGPPTRLHANRNNPCFDELGAGAGSGCTPLGTAPTPADTFPVPSADLAAQKTACGASGLPNFTPTQVPGEFSLFAPDAANADLFSAAYVSQNVGTGAQCTTTMSVEWRDSTPPTGGWRMVLAFGGRIASALDWGDGNSAGAISGSPFHLSVLELDGTRQGNQDLSMSVSAVAAPPTPITTQVSHTQIIAGSKLTDTATLTGVPMDGSQGGPPTGTVQFQLCSNTTTRCPQGTGRNIGSPVDLTPIDSTNNSSATSKSFGSKLAPGDYCVGVVYMNDEESFYSSVYHPGPNESPTSECFTVLEPHVFAAYYDTERTGGTQPSPWDGDSNVIFVGCDNAQPSDCPTSSGGNVLYDTGALRLDNPTGQAMTVTNASVTIGSCSYTPWPGLDVQVPGHEMLILTQTARGHRCSGTTVPTNFNFDTSDSASLSAPCTPNGMIPVVHVTVNGKALTYDDTQQILNTGGIDPDRCSGANESHPWAGGLISPQVARS